MKAVLAESRAFLRLHRLLEQQLAMRAAETGCLCVLFYRSGCKTWHCDCSAPTYPGPCTPALVQQLQQAAVGNGKLSAPVHPVLGQQFYLASKQYCAIALTRTNRARNCRAIVQDKPQLIDNSEWGDCF